MDNITRYVSFGWGGKGYKCTNMTRLGAMRYCYDITLNDLERPVITWAQVLGSYSYYLRGVCLRRETRGFRAQGTSPGSVFHCTDRNKADTIVSAGGFDVGFPCHSACVFLQSPFFVSPPPRHAGGPREVFDGGVPYHSACVFLQLLFFSFFLAS